MAAALLLGGYDALYDGPYDALRGMPPPCVAYDGERRQLTASRVRLRTRNATSHAILAHVIAYDRELPVAAKTPTRDQVPEGPPAGRSQRHRMRVLCRLIVMSVFEANETGSLHDPAGCVQLRRANGSA
jgi:hypothetical protein